jgi:hypothetical protein
MMSVWWVIHGCRKDIPVLLRYDRCCQQRNKEMMREGGRGDRMEHMHEDVHEHDSAARGCLPSLTNPQTLSKQLCSKLSRVPL